MSDPKHKIVPVLATGMLFGSFLVLMTALKGDNMLRIGLAAGGFLGFASLYVALLVARSRAQKA
jgi:hypothetical protein